MVTKCSSRDPSIAFVLSHFEARKLLSVRSQSGCSGVMVKGPFSVDIGRRSIEEICVLGEGIGVGCEEAVVVATWEELKKMGKKGRVGAYECFLDGKVAPCKIAGISEVSGRSGSLYPAVEGKAPTVVLGGFGMHRLKGTNPCDDTAAKIEAVGKEFLKGEVLDLCTGLGYTAIAAAAGGDVSGVVTVELDPMMVEIQRRNPWSEGLFDEDGKIERVVGDATEVVKGFESGRFEVVLHDPPARAIAGELYSREFYGELRRVCKDGGRLFHYIGDPASGESGKLYKGVVKRLREVGFVGIEISEEAYGVVGYAGG